MRGREASGCPAGKATRSGSLRDEAQRQLGLVEGPADEADVDAAVLEGLHLLLERELAEDDLDAGRARPEGAEQLGQPADGDRRGVADRDAPRLPRGSAPRLAHADLEGLEHPARVLVERRAGRRQLDAPAESDRRGGTQAPPPAPGSAGSGAVAPSPAGAPPGQNVALRPPRGSSGGGGAPPLSDTPRVSFVANELIGRIDRRAACRRPLHVDRPYRAEAPLHLRRDVDAHRHPGVATILRMPTDIFPDIDIPVISVVWNYTGLPPEEMESGSSPTTSAG